MHLPKSPAKRPHLVFFGAIIVLTFLLGGCSQESSVDSRPTVKCEINYPANAPSADRAGADPLVGQQWHLNNTGQSGGIAGEDLHAFAAWPQTQGSGVVVAVTDDAIETVHADLRQNVLAGKSYNYRDGSDRPLPCTKDEDHGTGVAGLLLARNDNAVGGAGVAPRASLVGFNALSTNLDSDGTDAMTRELAIVDIYHNSWGSPDNGALNNAPPLWEAAVAKGLAEGRQGKGAVYVFAAGNGGVIELPLTNGGITYVSETSNFDGYVNKRGIITACAVDDRGQQPARNVRGSNGQLLQLTYTEPGSNVLICAPVQSSAAGADAVTTNINPLIGQLDNYRDDFNGTSAATPMVSGVAALVLAANPNLTWRDVQQVLARSARNNDPTSPTWMPSAIAGKRYSHAYGYGVADAQAAVALARSWSSIGNSASQLSCGPYSGGQGLPIADAPNAATPGATLTDAINITDCAIQKIEFVEITFDSDHTYGAELNISLRSPVNHISELATARGCGDVSLRPDPCRSVYDNWRFGSVRHFDEAVNGRWQLEVSDAGPGDTGKVNSWRLRFYGR